MNKTVETPSVETVQSTTKGRKMPYEAPVLSEYGNMAALTKGTGSGLVDLLSQQVTLTVQVL